MHRFDLSSGVSVEVGFGEQADTLQSVSNHVSTHPNRPRVATLHQIHSDICIERVDADDKEFKADAHWSSSHGIALAVKTADCLPVLGTIPSASKHEGPLLIAIHAGWRGVASNIIGKSIQHLRSSCTIQPSQFDWNQRLSNARFWIGPHIRMQSFKIKRDALEPLQVACREVGLCAEPKSSDKLSTSCESLPLTRSLGANEFQFDLLSLALRQFQLQGIRSSQVDISNAFDSVSDHRFHSHRRDREKAGRNISWITVCS